MIYIRLFCVLSVFIAVFFPFLFVFFVSVVSSLFVFSCCFDKVELGQSNKRKQGRRKKNRKMKRTKRRQGEETKIKRKNERKTQRCLETYVCFSPCFLGFLLPNLTQNAPTPCKINVFGGCLFLFRLCHF